MSAEDIAMLASSDDGSDDDDNDDGNGGSGAGSLKVSGEHNDGHLIINHTH